MYIEQQFALDSTIHHYETLSNTLEHSYSITKNNENSKQKRVLCQFIYLIAYLMNVKLS